MTENKNDQHSLQAGNNSGEQSMQRNENSPRDKTTIQVQEIEEWDLVMPDQRRPQFRSNENYRRRNF